MTILIREVLYDDFAILFDDPDHSDDDERFFIIGETETEQICIVSHCYRGHENVICIISARRATRTEQRSYLDGIPYQTLINLYLRDCADNRSKIQMSWQ